MLLRHTHSLLIFLSLAATTLAQTPSPEPSLTVKGTLLDEASYPIQNAIVAMVPGSGMGEKSDAQGQFTFSLPLKYLKQVPDNYLLIRHLDRNLAAAFFQPHDADDLHITLRPGIHIHGRLLESTGEPSINTRVFLRLTSDHGRWAGAGLPEDTLTTGSDGRFDFPAVPPPPSPLPIPIANSYSYVIQARAPGNVFRLVRLVNAHDQKVDVGDIIGLPDDKMLTFSMVNIFARPLTDEEHAAHETNVERIDPSQPESFWPLLLKLAKIQNTAAVRDCLLAQSESEKQLADEMAQYIVAVATFRDLCRAAYGDSLLQTADFRRLAIPDMEELVDLHWQTTAEKSLPEGASSMQLIKSANTWLLDCRDQKSGGTTNTDQLTAEDPLPAKLNLLQKLTTQLKSTPLPTLDDLIATAENRH